MAESCRRREVAYSTMMAWRRACRPYPPGPRSAVFYSFLGSCLRRGLNLRAYLHWLFTRIAAEGAHAPHTLTPAAYAAFIKPVPVPAHAA